MRITYIWAMSKNLASKRKGRGERTELRNGDGRKAHRQADLQSKRCTTPRQEKINPMRWEQ